ncbi:uncharacterized protein [Embiotoca jacksoni]|uniref:uncharacterized protein n=1 Tax=Embiotoca jacksoni TaxID=100190 RepID=UPI0037047A04
MAEACAWPAAEWAVRLLPLLTGEAQTAALGLPPRSRRLYTDVKRVIMDRLGLSPVDHRRSFREAKLGPGDRPFAFAQRLRDSATRWLQPESAGGAPAMVGKIVGEQFTEGLPARTAAWVRCRHLATLEAAVTLAEDHLAVHPSGQGDGSRPPAAARPIPAPRRRIQQPGVARALPAPWALTTPRFTDPTGPAGPSTLPNLQGVPQPPGQECWRCGQPGHCRRECPLMEAGQMVRVAGPPTPSPGPGAMYRSSKDPGGTHQAMVDSGCMQSLIHQSLVRPGALVEALWEMIFRAAHYNQMAGHMGYDKTLDRIMARFYWPGSRGDARRWCASCPECQLVNQPAILRAPLHPLPLMEVPFDRIGMDLIGPFHRRARGYRFVLVLVDYSTPYPEAVPLRSISAKSVVQVLFQVISRVGIPKEILTDQRTQFMSRTLRELYGLLGIKSIRTSVYHPQTDGFVERLNKTLKSMIRKFIHGDGRNQDKWLDPLLFAVREVPQASTGFSPFDLLFGRKPRGVLDLLKENWEEGPSSGKSEIQYVLDLRAKRNTLGQMSRENLLQAQECQQWLYNTKLSQFTPGEKVLVLLPSSSSKLLAKWQGPFVVTRRVGDVDYEVVWSDRGGATQLYHLNLLKAWREAESVSLERGAGARDSKVYQSCLAPFRRPSLRDPENRRGPVAEAVC